MASAALEVELELVRNGRLPATFIWTPYDALGQLLNTLARHGLDAAPLDAVVGEILDSRASTQGDPRELLTYGIVVSRSAQLDDACQRLTSSDAYTIARWQGYPDCCATSWARHLASGFSDPIVALLLDEHGNADSPASHALLASLGVGPVRHAPCSTDCQATAEEAQSFMDTARSLGFTDEASWMHAMGDWIVDVSVVAGMAEVKTGVLRYSWPSDSLGADVRRCRIGSELPEAAAAGLSPVFAPPKSPSRPVRGRSAPKAAGGATIGFIKAGFASAVAMRSRFSTVLWEQSALLRRSFGSAIHLGCGDGLMLELLAQHRPTLKLIGVEVFPGLARAARLRDALADVPILAESWSQALTALTTTIEPNPLVFLDPEELASQSPEHIAAVLNQLDRLDATVVLFTNDRALMKFDGVEALAASVGLSVMPGRPKRVSAALQRQSAVKAVV